MFLILFSIQFSNFVKEEMKNSSVIQKFIESFCNIFLSSLKDDRIAPTEVLNDTKSSTKDSSDSQLWNLLCVSNDQIEQDQVDGEPSEYSPNRLI